MALLSNAQLDVSIIIVNWNTKDLLLSCISSVYSSISKNLKYEIIVVDNGSHDGSSEAVKKSYPQVLVIQNKKNLGFAAANNIAFKIMKGKYALLLNTDCTLTKGAVEALYSFMEEHPEAGITCGQLLNPDGSKQNSFSNFPSLLEYITNKSLLKIIWPSRFPSKYNSYNKPIEVDSCIGACVLLRKEAIEEVGYFDEDYFFFFEETDLAFRLKKAGWKVYFVPCAKIYHAQGKSVGSNITSRALFYKSMYTFLKKHYQIHYIYKGIIFLRLIINTLLNLAGTIFTFGLNKSVKHRFFRYLLLIYWHIRGCPQLYPEERQNGNGNRNKRCSSML
ncbi:MAG: glycosyltransferase family 2 protein [Deltaproteobacteria bacterium]|nr:MAG: glycosyltransferase family 2 protein [Deltaproteobacteria bacterium]